METEKEKLIRLSNSATFAALKVSFRENCTLSGNGSKFRKDSPGVLPKLMAAYYADRKKYKKMMLAQEALLVKDPENADIKRKIVQYNNMQSMKKVALNSCYGALSNPGFRYYNDDLAEAITLTGQVAIRWAAIRMNLFMNKLLKTKEVDYVIASDTDSLYIKMNGLVAVMKQSNPNISEPEIVEFLDKAIKARFEPYIDQFFEELATRTNALERKIFMKREVIASRAIWTGGKRYIMNVWDKEGVRYDKPKFKMVGIEAVRSTTPAVCRVAIEEGAKIIIANEQEKLYTFIQDFDDTFRAAAIQDIATNSSMNNLKKYEACADRTPPHVAGAILYNRLLREHFLTDSFPLIKDGDRVKFFRMRKPNPWQANWFAFPNGAYPAQIEAEKYIDFDTLAENSFRTPLQTIASAAGMSIELKADLFSFFE